MSEIYVWWNNQFFMTSSQIKKLQKKMKKSYKKASLIKEKMEKYHDEEIKEAEKLLKKIDLIN